MRSLVVGGLRRLGSLQTVQALDEHETRAVDVN
jgi:hypothetical protein